MTRNGVHVPVLFGRRRRGWAMAYGAASIRLTVIVGRDGKIVRTMVGVHPESDLRGAGGRA